MGKIKNNEAAFSPVEVVMVLVIVALIGVVGFMVYKSHNKKTTSISTTTTSATTTPTQSTTKTTTAQAPAPVTNACGVVATKAPSDWKTFTSSGYKFNISYPSSWYAVTSGGAENNSSHTPLLTQLLFTPPGNQGSQYGISVTAQTLPAAITDWENEVKEAQSNSAGTTFTILSKGSCIFGSHDAERIDTKQSYGTTIVYDTEFYVVGNNYAYKFSTGYTQSDSNPLKNATLLGVVQSLSVQ